VKPVLQALVVAEKVYEDVTGKKIIAGTFTSVGFMRSPPIREIELPDGSKQTQIAGGMHGGSPCAYVSLTDICTETKIRLQFVNLTKNMVMFGTELTIKCPDRLRTVEIAAPLPDLPINEEGVYALEVVCEEEILGSYRITAKEVRLEEGTKQ
jgi:hypothetical protein